MDAIGAMGADDDCLFNVGGSRWPRHKKCCARWFTDFISHERECIFHRRHDATFFYDTNMRFG